MNKLLSYSLIMIIVLAPLSLQAEDNETYFIHLKTSFKKDPTQIPVAYNVMWAAIEEGFTVKVLVDAGAINSYKSGLEGIDDIEVHKIPERLRLALAGQFGVSPDVVPKTYGDFLIMLKDKGVEFYMNKGFLIASKIGTPEEPLNKISAKYFKPVTLRGMVRMRAEAKYYMVY
jgi:hypothetical protein